MKGLTSVLDRFSEGLKSRKILPSLLEEVRAILTRQDLAMIDLILDERHSPTSIYSSERLRHF